MFSMSSQNNMNCFLSLFHGVDALWFIHPRTVEGCVPVTRKEVNGFIHIARRRSDKQLPPRDADRTRTYFTPPASRMNVYDWVYDPSWFIRTIQSVLKIAHGRQGHSWLMRVNEIVCVDNVSSNLSIPVGVIMASYLEARMHVLTSESEDTNTVLRRHSCWFSSNREISHNARVAIVVHNTHSERELTSFARIIQKKQPSASVVGVVCCSSPLHLRYDDDEALRVFSFPLVIIPEYFAPSAR